MDTWKKCVFISCLYGFFKEFCPLVPFLTPYLTEPHEHNITKTDLFSEIYPITTLTRFAALFFVLIVSDFFIYKPVIIFGAGASIATWCLLGWSQGLLPLIQVSLFFRGLAQASDVAFFAYIFAVSSPASYQKVSGLSKSAILISQCLSYSVGQAVLSLTSVEIQTLVFASLGSVILAFVVGAVMPDAAASPYYQSEVIQRELLVPRGLQHSSSDNGSPYGLPNNTGNHGNIQISPDGNAQPSGVDISSVFVPVSTHMYSDIDTSSLGYPYSDGNSDISDLSTNEDCIGSAPMETRLSNCKGCCSATFKTVWKDVCETYKNRTVVVWSLWYVAASCVDVHVRQYSEELWDVLSLNSQHSRSFFYNGAVQAIAALLGVVLCLSMGFLRIHWHRFEESFIGVVMVLSSAVLAVMSHTNIWSAYIFCIIFLAVFQMLSTVAMFQIAGHLTCRRFGLVFGFNSFLSLFIEVVFLTVIARSNVLGATIITQFTLYSGLLGVAGVLFITRALYASISSGERRFSCCQQEEQEFLVEDPS